MGDGDGWVRCAAGHRHWGRFGAAGLLISDDGRAILQHRAPWTHEGGTWGLPGGARDSHEDPTSTALREAREEAAIDARSVVPLALSVNDHGGWSYTTVLARAVAPISPHAANAESTDVRWWDTPDIDSLPLHDGLAATWPILRQPAGQLTLVVDVRVRPEAVGPSGLEPWPRLEELARRGVSVAALPAGLAGAAVAVLLPRIKLIGAPASEPSPAANTGTESPPGGADELDGLDALGHEHRWWQRAITATEVVGDPADALLTAARDLMFDERVVVVSLDPIVRQVLASDPAPSGRAATAIVGPDWLTDELDRFASA